MIPFEGEAWPAEALTDTSHEALFKASLARYESAERDADTIRRNSRLSLAGGLALGLMGMGYGLVVQIRAPVQEPPQYILVHDTLGTIDRPLGAVDVPRVFGETVRERALRDFIVACESYVPETWQRLDFHACMILATPAEQKRRDADIGRLGPHYPPSVFGVAGWAMPTKFLAFVKLGEVGTAPSQTFHYQVRYERTEIESGRETRPHYTADVTFSFRPELKISADDRLLNPAGTQVISFSTTKDGP
jgi:VirB8 protein